VRPNDLWSERRNSGRDGGIRTLKPTGEPQSTRGVGNTTVKRLAPVPIRLEEISTRAVDDVFALRPSAQWMQPPAAPGRNCWTRITRAVTIKQGASSPAICRRVAGISHRDITPEKAQQRPGEVRTIGRNAVVSQIRLRCAQARAVEFLDIDNNDRLYVSGPEHPDAASGATTFGGALAAMANSKEFMSFRWRTTADPRFVTISGDGTLLSCGPANGGGLSSASVSGPFRNVKRNRSAPDDVIRIRPDRREHPPA